MKKIISLMVSVSLILLTNAGAFAAKIGEKIGVAYHTDIVAYINNYAIPSYAVNGTSVIVAEDLVNFGFRVDWNQVSRTLNISREYYKFYPSEMNFTKNGEPGTVFADLLATDITVYAGGIKIPSYAINGYTMIPIESLNMFGECYWVANERAIKLWIDELNIRDTKQNITTYNTMELYNDSRGVSRSISIDPFDVLQEYIVKQGSYNGGNYHIVDSIAENSDGFFVMTTSPTANMIMLSSIYDDHLCSMAIEKTFPNIFAFTFDYNDGFVKASGVMQKNSINIDTTEYVTFTEYESPMNDYKLKNMESGLTAIELRLILSCTERVLIEEDLPIRISDLGFTNFFN